MTADNPLAGFDLSAMFNAMPMPEPGPRFQPLPQRTFPAASLNAWLDLAQSAGVAFVPATTVGFVAIDALLRSDQPELEGVAEAVGQMETANTNLPEGQMLRWDCCAGFEVKAALSEGNLPTHEQRQLTLDPRSFDLLFEFPADEVALVQRPWVTAQEIDGFPVEFRVFVAHGEVQAVANYYLQRPLPDTPAIRKAVAECIAASEALWAVIRGRGVVPAMPFQKDPQEDQTATLDFLVDEEGNVLFLEAGPGWGFGAHPCAFLREDNRTVEPVQGIKLSQHAPSIPLQ